MANVDHPSIEWSICISFELTDNTGIPNAIKYFIQHGNMKHNLTNFLQMLAKFVGAKIRIKLDYNSFCVIVNSTGNNTFLTLLPLYLNEILFPNFSDEVFKKVIYETNLEGMDDGLMYKKLINEEDNAKNNMIMLMVGYLFNNECWISCNYNGQSKEVKQQLNIQAIKKFHSKYFVWENVHFIIVGGIDPDEVFNKLEDYQNHLEKSKLTSENVYLKKQCPTCSPSEKVVKYCERKNSSLMIGWRGPLVSSELVKVRGINYLLEHITSQQYLIDNIKEFGPDINAKFDLLVTPCSGTALIVTFMNDFDQPKKLVKEFQNLLKNIVDGKQTLKIDSIYSTIRQTIRIKKHHLESNSINHITLSCISYLKYGENKNFHIWLNAIQLDEELLKKKEDFWLNLIQEYFTSKYFIVIENQRINEQTVKNPSIDFSFIKARKTVQKKFSYLHAIEDLNEDNNVIEITDTAKTTYKDLQNDFKVSKHNIVTYQSNGEKKHAKFDLDTVPVFMQLVDINTNFVYINLLIDTKHLTTTERVHLILYNYILLSLSKSFIIQSLNSQFGDSLIKEDDVLSLESSFGDRISDSLSCSHHCHIFILSIKLTPDKYKEGIQFLYRLIYKNIISITHIESAINDILDKFNYLKEVSSTDFHQANIIQGYLFGNGKSSIYSVNQLIQEEYLNKLQEDISSSETGNTDIQNEFDAFLQSLRRPEIWNVQLICDVENLFVEYNDLGEPWKKLVPEERNYNKAKIPTETDKIEVSRKLKEEDVYWVTVDGYDGITIFQSVTISDELFNDYHIFLVFRQYMSCTQMDIVIAVEASMTITYEENYKYLSILFTSSAADEFVEFYEHVVGFLKDFFKTEEWDEKCIENAKSYVMKSLIDKEKRLQHVINNTLVSFLNNSVKRDISYFLETVPKVTKESLSSFYKKYFSSILSEESKLGFLIISSPGTYNTLSNDLSLGNRKDISSMEEFVKIFLKQEEEEKS
ncbi:uncharacterized protein LOC142319672 [Lycorma delicatula]|uniref:uncharacterized protein LOC142319672 n=1 Tax=Lycorma delicatula TaxID=130591 RepID=UPI003F514FEA